jgi:hypothetical protein
MIVQVLDNFGSQFSRSVEQLVGQCMGAVTIKNRVFWYEVFKEKIKRLGDCICGTCTSIHALWCSSMNEVQ